MMAMTSFKEPACPDHRSGEYAAPWLAVRFAHLCQVCGEIVERAVLEHYGVLEVARARQAREALGMDWDLLHDSPTPDPLQFLKARRELAGSMADADVRFEAAAAALRAAFDAKKPRIVEDVLYVLDPPLGRIIRSRWVLGHSILFQKVQAKEVVLGRRPVDIEVDLPSSRWPGRFFMIQDVADPDRPERTVARYVEVTPWVLIDRPKEEAGVR